MSLPTVATVTCPCCTEPCQVTIWRTVNVTIEPGLRQPVLDRTLQSGTCSHCKHQFRFSSDLIYHDMDQKFMLSLVRSDSERQFTAPSSTVTAAGRVLPKYRLRFVTSYNQLVEKIRIFEAGLNDFAIEGLKMLSWHHQFPQNQITDDSMYFCAVQGSGLEESLLFECHENGKPLAQMSVPLSMYTSAMTQTGDQITNYRLGEWILVNQSSFRDL